MDIKQALCLTCNQRNSAVTPQTTMSRESWPLGYTVTPVTAIFLKNNYFYFSSHSSIGKYPHPHHRRHWQRQKRAFVLQHRLQPR